MKPLFFKATLFTALAVSVLLISCNKKCNCNLGPDDWTHFISKDSALKWIKNYKIKYQNDTATGAGNCANLVMLGRGDDFKHGKWMMGSMMCRENVIGFRIYYGIKTQYPNSIIPILVGVDISYNDVYWKKPAKGSSTITTDGDINFTEGAMDLSQKIPPPMSVGTTNMMEPQ